MVERGARHWPVEIRLKDRGHVLSVAFDDGRDFSLAAEYLRISSPSTEVQGHSPTERRIVAGKIDVAISEVIPVGNYAVRLVFDDRHQTGIFTWDYLYELGDRREANWTSYLSELAARKLQRES